MRSRTYQYISLLASLLAFATTPARAGDLVVVATIPDLASLATAVGGDTIEVATIALPGEDPHFVDPRPDHALRLHRADLVLLAGLDLEIGWLPTLLQGARNPAIRPGGLGYLDLGTAIQPLDVPRGPVDRSAGDVHPFGNPHYTLDPFRAVTIATTIARRLGRLSPEYAERFTRRARAFAAAVEGLWRETAPLRTRLRGLPVLTYHRTWTYLEERLGLVHLGELEPKPGIPPSPAHLLQLAQIAARRQPRAILVATWYPDRAARLLGERLGIPVLHLPAQTDFPRQSYLDHVRELLERLASLAEVGR